MSELLFEFLPPPQAERPYTVSEVNEGISLILDSSNMLVWVEGEISNYRVATSGHAYLRLKDAESQIPAVLWRQTADKLKFTPEEGMAVFAIASIKIYRKGGYYQLDIHRLEPRGKGAILLAFEQLKKKLERQGLFDPAHKRELPLSIQRIGVVTSKQGAAIRDIVRVVSSRAPQTDIVLIDVPVQGEAAAPKIAAAIRDLNAYANVDCIIVGRGGGSVEDLQPFNEEIVARAIYDSEIAVISAVGHEIDFTIADFVADVRAATPSAAAEIAAPDRMESRKYFDACASRFSGAITRYFDDLKKRYYSTVQSRSLKTPLQLLRERQQERDGYAEALARGFSGSFRTASSRFSSITARLHALSPLAVLSRGYSVVTTTEGMPVRSTDQIEQGRSVYLRFHKGSATATVTSVSPEQNQD
jgi:exodeoxyribonuclease VII large subunit